MALEGPVRGLIDEIKYRRRFPPREKATTVKNELATRGLGSSSMLAQQIAEAYVESVEQILDDFLTEVFAKAAALGLGGADLRAVIAAAHEELFNEARGIMLHEFKGGNAEYGKLAMGMLDGRRAPVWAHLERALELRKLEEVPAARVKEIEQKFGILLSPGQADRDFQGWAEEARKFNNPIMLAFVDIDHFKKLNERLSHATVDATVMPEVQRLLAKLVQGRGDGYRYGGEEFLLILPNLDEAEAKAFGEKVRATAEGHQFQVPGSVERITVSIGIALFPQNGETYQAVLKTANDAALLAKRRRNTVRLAGDRVEDDDS